MRSLITLLGLFLTLSTIQANESRMIVRVVPGHEAGKQIEAIESMHLDFVSEAGISETTYVVVTPGELNRIRGLGFTADIVQYEELALPIPPEYHTVQKTWDTLKWFHQQYPAITRLDTCGYSQRNGLPILHLVISKNPGIHEDEPVSLFTGVTHAREPMGNEICLYTIGWILRNYPANAKARKYVDSMELHFIPVINIDGWKYITDNNLASPWWRKNLRDNRVDGGAFDPSYDGVDLNRNWDWHWPSIGTNVPSNEDYYGLSAASEAEVKAVAAIALKCRPVVGISYHSYGPYVMYPYNFNSVLTQDNATILEMAQGITNAIGGYQAPRTLTGACQSSVWLYGRAGILDFTIETATSFIPDAASMNTERTKNFNGLTYLLDRCFYSGVTGHVLDSITREPLKAVVELLDQTGDSIVPRVSDSLYGRYCRLLKNGTYRMRFSKNGYKTKTISNISTVSDSLTYMDVLLARDILSTADPLARNGIGSRAVWPNPFGRQVVFGPDAKNSICQVVIHDANGRMVQRLMAGNALTVVWNGTDSQGHQLRPGVFFYVIAYANRTVSGKLIKIN